MEEGGVPYNNTIIKVTPPSRTQNISDTIFFETALGKIWSTCFVLFCFFFSVDTIHLLGAYSLALEIRPEHINRVFADKFFGQVGFLVVCFLDKINPQYAIKYLPWGKCGPNATFLNLFFLGLGWPWVGEFVGFHNNIYYY